MNQIKKIIYGSLFLIAVSLTTYAGLPFRVNEAHVNVPDQSDAALQKALPEALSQVLIKMSGNSKVTSLPAVRTALRYAKRWLVNYTYINAQDATGQPQLILQATFNRNAMNSLLRDANQNTWSENRPVTLIWLHVEKGPLNYYLSGNDHGEISIDVKNSAYRRGIPFRVPMMDVPDQQLFAVNDPNPFTQDRLQTAVQRYNAQAILAGHIIYDNKTQIWSADWHLLQNNQLTEWNNNASNINDTISQAVDRVADTLAGNINNNPATAATAAGEANSTANPENNIAQTVRMAVLGINNLDDYAKLTQYLQSLPGVSAVTVNDMNNAMVIVNINVDGGINTLVNDLQNSALLKSATPPADVTDNTVNAYYQWATADTNQSTNATNSAQIVQDNRAETTAVTTTAATASTAPELENTQ